MLKKYCVSVVVLAVLVGLSGTAYADRLGVVNGAIDSRLIEFTPAVTAVYDMDKFRAGGFFGTDIFTKNYPRVFKFGGDFYYKLHSSQMADISAGAVLGLNIIANLPANQGNQIGLLLGLGAQIRVFIVTNVSLDVGLGLGVLVDLNDKLTSEVAFMGDLMGSVGITYYFDMMGRKTAPIQPVASTQPAESTQMANP